jgi:hypothetical protein
MSAITVRFENAVDPMLVWPFAMDLKKFFVSNWDDEKLEKAHDYIQWLFPNWEKSGSNNKASCLKIAKPDLVKSLTDSLRRYGTSAGEAYPAADAERAYVGARG